ncbi:hypothetical protein MUK71_12305 [Arthrobacter zhangbolii]|uniref:Uncharacterized protein n=1 Tax=Arthrobacter zhangbolii TaxID=2886936 RepID=A0A9X1M869_9MICC|nr:hypothetical protein [Arthrobacter zhangbolii]MCC3272791.1 hypothetical protein [Arthrobacter zhangbolii]UON91375.1 hypothetical protein MUK71_12305 [Arthrobacter zhangbolii]
MYNTSTTPSGGGSTQSYAGRPGGQTPPAAFRIRKGRVALALTGLLALVTVLVGGVLAAATAVSWLIPAAGLAAAAASVIGLRSLALRDRRRRVQNAFRDAMGPDLQHRTGFVSPADQVLGEPEEAAPAAPPQPLRETVLFDLQAAPAPDAIVDAVPAALTTPPAEAKEPEAPKAPVLPPKTGSTPWEPVEVPKPVYVDAPKAPRPAPEPIVLPEPPRPMTKTPLRPGAVPAVPSAQERPETGKINLDDVLQRRRA